MKYGIKLACEKREMLPTLVLSYFVIYTMFEATVNEKIFYNQEDSDIDLTTSDGESPSAPRGGGCG